MSAQALARKSAEPASISSCRPGEHLKIVPDTPAPTLKIVRLIDHGCLRTRIVNCAICRGECRVH